MTPFTHPILALHSSQAELHFRCYMALHHWLQQKERSDLIFFWTESCVSATVSVLHSCSYLRQSAMVNPTFMLHRYIFCNSGVVYHIEKAE